MKYDQLPTDSLENGLRKIGCTEAKVVEVIRAVNSHDLLVNTLKAAQFNLKLVDPTTSLMKDIDKAIAQAEGK